MSAVQGVESSPSVAPQRTQTVQTPRPAEAESREAPRAERAAASRNTQAAAEQQAAASGNAAVGTRFSAIA